MYYKKIFFDRGIVHNIQRFSLHDGPGIRTTVFLKGCPLRCRWCSNPESQAHGPEIMVYSSRCIGCKRCAEVCTIQALSFTGSKVEGIDRNKCRFCFKCVEACPTNALELTGRIVQVSEVIAEVVKDRDFYVNSGGGVTFSGGEPMFQPDFLLNLLQQSKNKGLHTAVETCGYTEWSWFKKMLDLIDLVLYDVKQLDSRLHFEWTGVKNETILMNLKKIIEKDETKKIWVRIPIIPGFNDTRKDIGAFKELLQKIIPDKVSLLPYHTWGIGKYEKLNIEYNLKELVPPDTDKMEWIRNEIKSLGLDTDISR